MKRVFYPNNNINLKTGSNSPILDLPQNLKLRICHWLTHCWWLWCERRKHWYWPTGCSFGQELRGTGTWTKGNGSGWTRNFKSTVRMLMDAKGKEKTLCCILWTHKDSQVRTIFELKWRTKLRHVSMLYWITIQYNQSRL